MMESVIAGIISTAICMAVCYIVKKVRLSLHKEK